MIWDFCIAGGVSMACGNGTQISTLHKTWFTQSAKVIGEMTGFLHISTGKPNPLDRKMLDLMYNVSCSNKNSNVSFSKQLITATIPVSS